MVAKASGPLGLYGDREYIWVEADMYGKVAREDGTTGHYRVPVVLMYPDKNGNGFGFVDLINSADFARYHKGNAPLGKRSVYHMGEVICGDYLRREGCIYFGVQWAKMVTQELGADYGVIEEVKMAMKS